MRVVSSRSTFFSALKLTVSGIALRWRRVLWTGFAKVCQVKLEVFVKFKSERVHQSIMFAPTSQWWGVDGVSTLHMWAWAKVLRNWSAKVYLETCEESLKLFCGTGSNLDYSMEVIYSAGNVCLLSFRWIFYITVELTTCSCTKRFTEQFIKLTIKQYSFMISGITFIT